ncbi:MAG: ABC transporter permease, partial [Sphingobacteriales bacterium]
LINVDKPTGLRYLSEKQLGIFSQEQVDRDLNDVLERERMVRANIDTARLSAIKENSISISQQLINEGDDNQAANAGISSAIGYVSGFLIYLLMFIYGTMVMRGIMEEKVNRVAEVMVSSVKPFQLMMGKIIGIGAVGITQFLIWILLLTIGTAIMGSEMNTQELTQLAESQSAGTQRIMMGAMTKVVGQLNIPLLTGAFLFYFLFGYLFYAALFAAVGSAVNEDPQDAQAMMFPITIPIVFSIIVMTSAIGNPTSPLAVWCSIIPFTSPVIMMARLPFGFPGTVAWWELALSVVALIGGFLFTTWLSAKIYRTGILMYGKKASWKDMLVWAFRR